jgi:hypothetical protein
MIFRAVFELWLHTEAIIEPISELLSKSSSNDDVTILEKSKQYVMQEAVDRLRAYTAWCLRQDIFSYEKILEQETFNGIWSPDSALEIATDPDKIDAYEAFFGPLNETFDINELKQKSNESRKYILEKQKQVNEWFEDQSLSEWNNILKKKKRNASFFSLFKQDEENIYKRLSGTEFEFAYSLYKLQSQIIHGSTINQFLHVGEGQIYPQFVGSEVECEYDASSIVTSCKSIFFNICYIQKQVWN